MQDYIEIKNAKVHNLKNISLKLPKNKLIVFTGVSGSGKSSLAFDTLYAEGQRRYVESLSSYARQFLGLMEKPDVESITGLSPAISIDQKTSSTNPRSTVGTITEIYDYLRLLFGHIGTMHCPNCGKQVVSQTIDEIVSDIKKLVQKDSKLIVSAPIVQNIKGTFKSLLSSLLAKGFLRIKLDDIEYTLDEINKIQINKNKKHNLDLIIDRIKISKENIESEETTRRIRDAIELATSMADGEVKIDIDKKQKLYSENNSCTKCRTSFPKLKPSSFSFNAPYGACPKCTGLGYIKEIEISKIFNPKLSILEGGIFPWSNLTTSNSWTLKILTSLSEKHSFDLKTPIGKLSQNIFDLIFYGKNADDKYTVQYTNRFGHKRIYDAKYEGVIPQLERRYHETQSEYIREETEKYMIEKACSDCQGKRLQPYVLGVKIDEKNIDDISNMQISESISYFRNLKLKGNTAEIANPIIKEILTRLEFLSSVGLNYLTLSRRANTLSGGESQRIRLASQIGTALTGVLYVLDEPSIGLHPRDVFKLLNSLESLRDLGNTVVIVEHDEETMKRADWIVDIGKYAGENGGEIVAEGDIKAVKQSGTLTANYLDKSLTVGDSLKTAIRQNPKNDIGSIKISGVKTHNLQDIDVTIPMGKFVSITGVSGSGKSSLINDTLYPAIKDKLGEKVTLQGDFNTIEGYEKITKVIDIDQSPIGRTPRSNPATYTGIFTPIREIFSKTPESRARGYTPSRFSFNVKGGRCEKCKGDGQIRIEMQLRPDMYVTCEECNGKRYNNDALQIEYKNKNISDVLQMTVDEALSFFSNFSMINSRLTILKEVGLGYIRLGQPATTLSGGESQRIKLAKELAKSTRGHTLYILDEPTTGLHFYDVDKLLLVLKRLVSNNNTVVVIEHNTDIIKHSDWIIDLGPEGGNNGGQIIAQGSVQDIKNSNKSYTGKYL